MNLGLMTGIGKNIPPITDEAGDVIAGEMASATGRGGIAVGSNARASGAHGVAVGHVSGSTSVVTLASGAGAIAIGGSDTPLSAGGANAFGGPQATNECSIAIGSAHYSANIAAAQAAGQRAVAIGGNSSASAASTVALGMTASASVSSAVAVGNAAAASAASAMAIGPAAAASSTQGLAIGASAQASTGNESIAIGSGSNTTAGPAATAQGAIAIGASDAGSVLGARASDVSSIAIGSGDATNAGASVSGGFTGGIAVGTAAVVVNGHRGVVLGMFARANGATSSVVIGGASTLQAAPQATAACTIAIGGNNNGAVNGARASGASAIALGAGDVNAAGAAASAADAIAIGRGASAAHSRATAMGQGATTTAVNQIMMGTSSDQVYIPGTIRIPTGAAAGSVLTSDVNGVGSWAAAVTDPTVSYLDRMAFR